MTSLTSRIIDAVEHFACVQAKQQSRLQLENWEGVGTTTQMAPAHQLLLHHFADLNQRRLPDAIDPLARGKAFVAERGRSIKSESIGRRGAPLRRSGAQCRGEPHRWWCSAPCPRRGKSPPRR